MRFSKSNAADVAVTIVACAAAASLFFLFLRDLSSSLPGEKSGRVGSIVFRKNAATRKFDGSLRWLRLANGSSVFSGDTVRTSSRSEAAVVFDDGSSLDVFENSMLKLDFPGDERVISLSSGSLRVSGTSSARRVVQAGSSRVEIAPDSDVSFDGDGDRLVLDVLSGSVVVTGANGHAETIGANGEGVIDVSRGEVSARSFELMPIFPARGDSLVSPNGKKEIEFRVSASPDFFASSGEGVPRIEIASDARFTAVIGSEPLSRRGDVTFGATASLEPGSWFWRAVSGSGEKSPAMGFSFSISEIPRQTVPVEGASVAYRSILPTVRFFWAESLGAAGYTLELARNPDGSGEVRRVRATTPFVAIPALSDGPWYWRVRAEYAGRETEVPGASPFRSFAVTQAEAMPAPAPIVPLDGTLYETGRAESGMVFSWARMPEASSYVVRFFSDIEGRDEIGAIETKTPTVNVRASQVPALSEKGFHRWSVSWVDAEGTVSPPSEIRTVTGVESASSLRATFPPEGFVSSADAVSSIRFSWRGASLGRAKIFFVPAGTDGDGKAREIERESSVDSASGLDIPAGVWSWFVRTPNADGTTFQETEPRVLRVVAALPAPKILEPASRSEIVAFFGDTIRISWESVADADHYEFLAYGPEKPDAPIASDARIDGTTYSLPVSGSGQYRFSVRAAAEPGLTSTRIAGLAAEGSVTVSQFERLTLVSPKEGSRVDGLTAWRNGIRLSWSSADEPDAVTYDVRRDGKKYPVAVSRVGTSRDGVSRSITLARLPSGSYTWTVRAEKNGMDVSPSVPSRFTVLPVPPLPAPTAVSPEARASLGPEYFLRENALTFAWEAVKGADSYSFRLITADRRRVVYVADRVEGTSVSIRDLSILDRGSYVWEVTAFAAKGDSSPARSGKRSSASFSIVLPPLTAPERAGTGTFYGK